jgi:hypothetical protein
VLVIEHGVGGGRLDDGADSSRDAEAPIMNGFEGVLVEDALLGSCQFELMGHVVSGLLGAEAGHVVRHGNALVEGPHDGKLHDPSEFGLTGQKRFFVFPDRLESVKLRELNSSTALLTKGWVFGLPRIFRPGDKRCQ